MLPPPFQEFCPNLLFYGLILTFSIFLNCSAAVESHSLGLKIERPHPAVPYWSVQRKSDGDAAAGSASAVSFALSRFAPLLAAGASAAFRMMDVPVAAASRLKGDVGNEHSFLLFQAFLEEVDQLVKGDDIRPVVEAGVDSIRDREQFLVVPSQLGEGILAEVAGVGLITVSPSMRHSMVSARLQGGNWNLMKSTVTTNSLWEMAAQTYEPFHYNAVSAPHKDTGQEG